MNPDDSQHELLLRYLDGRISPAERQRVAELLRAEPAAREFLRTVSEQAVMVADLERIAAGREEVLRPRQARMENAGRKTVTVNFRTWQWRAAAAVVIALLAVFAFRFVPKIQPGMIRVTKVTGSSQYFGANGRIENVLPNGTTLGPGDTLETRSCDAWIELKLRDNSTITIAGNSTLRILDPESGGQRFKLSRGSLWVSPAPGTAAKPLSIQTPTVAAETLGAQFDIQASPAETMLRVNSGSARVKQFLDNSTVEVLTGHQVTASLSRKESLGVMPQPTPINYWACDLWKVPEVTLGKCLPPTGNERARLRADPLLWPRPGRDPLMLYAVALAAWKSTDHPVVLHSDSKLRFRGRTERAQMVRFGFSAQKMRGAFAGKFEIDVQPATLGSAGETWDVVLPLTDFRLLHPHLAASPEGLELTDVYALTVKEDAGLEINHIELVPGMRSVP